MPKGIIEIQESLVIPFGADADDTLQVPEEDILEKQKSLSEVPEELNEFNEDVPLEEEKPEQPVPNLHPCLSFF